MSLKSGYSAIEKNGKQDGIIRAGKTVLLQLTKYAHNVVFFATKIVFLG
jgi:hypothetical protein